MDFLTEDFITQMVLWVSIGASTLLCVLILMIYWKDKWCEVED